MIGLSASRRRKGNSEVLLLEAARGARAKGADVELYRLPDLKISECRGCLACAFKGECSQKDDLPGLVERMVEADGLIVSAPTYVLSPSGVIKKVMDRAMNLAPYLKALEGTRRAGASISVAGNPAWNPLGVEALNQFALAYGFPVTDYLEVYAPGPGESLLSEDNINSARRMGEHLVAYLKGERHRRPPNPRQCPVCYSRSLRFLPDGSWQCPFCLTSATEQNGNLTFNPDESFWAPANRRRKLKEWIMATKDIYLNNRELIKEKLETYREDFNLFKTEV